MVMPLEGMHKRQEIAIEQQLKFNYSFTALIFGTLAISVQFSPKMGPHFPWLLVIAWILLMSSSIAGGYVLMKLYSREALERVFEFTDLGKVYERAFAIRLWGFLLGVGVNLLFAVINYLYTADRISFCICN
jgi:hypothetical protein